jgi:surface protein
LDANSVTVKYVGSVPTSDPLFIYANPRGTGPEWFAVVKQSTNMKTAITNYAGGTSAPFIPSAFGQTSPVPFNNIVTTLMTNIADIFAYKTSFNSPIASWDTSNIITMESVFMVANSFNQPIDKWYTGAVTNMSFMFFNATSFNRPIGAWNTSNVTTMRSLFNNAIAFNQPIGAWNTSKVTNMNNMFYNVGAFNQNISAWNVASVTPKPPTEFSSGSGITAQNSPFGVAFAAPIISNSGIVTYSGTTASMTYTVATGVTAVQVRKASDNTPVSGATSSISSLTATITVPFTDAASPLDITVVALANTAGRESAASATQTLIKQFAAPTISGSITYSGTTASMTYTVATGVTAVQLRKASDNSALSNYTPSGTSVAISYDFSNITTDVVVVALANAAGRESAASVTQKLLKQFAAPVKASEPVYTGSYTASMTYTVDTGVSAVQVRKASDNTTISGATSSISSLTATITVPFTDAESPFNFVVVASGNPAGRESAASATQTLIKQFAAPTISGSITYSGTTASMTYTVPTGVTAVQVRRVRQPIPTNFYLLTAAVFNDGAVSPLVANTNLLAWNIDNQFLSSGGGNRIYEQMAFAARVVAGILNVTEQANLTVISGGGSSNGSIMTITNIGNNNASIYYADWTVNVLIPGYTPAPNPNITGVNITMNATTATITVPISEADLPLYFVVAALANAIGRESAASATQTLKQFAAPTLSGSITYSGNTASMTYTVASGVTRVSALKASDTTYSVIPSSVMGQTLANFPTLGAMKTWTFTINSSLGYANLRSASDTTKIPFIVDFRSDRALLSQFNTAWGPDQSIMTGFHNLPRPTTFTVSFDANNFIIRYGNGLFAVYPNHQNIASIDAIQDVPVTDMSSTGPVINRFNRWEMRIAFRSTGKHNAWRALIGDMRNVTTTNRGWGVWINPSNNIHFSWNDPSWDASPALTVAQHTDYVLAITKTSASLTLELTDVAAGTTQTATNTSMASYIMSANGPVTLGGWINHAPDYLYENFVGTISYVNVVPALASAIPSSGSATLTMPLTDSSPVEIKVVALANADGRESAASASQTLLKQFAAPTISGSITYSGTTASMTYTVAPGVTRVSALKASDTMYSVIPSSVMGQTLANFPIQNAMYPRWEMSIAFRSTGKNNAFRALIGDKRNQVNSGSNSGWSVNISDTNTFMFTGSDGTVFWNASTITFAQNTDYVLTLTKTSASLTVEVTNVTANTTQTATNTAIASNSLSPVNGPVTLGGWINNSTENFVGTISYVNVVPALASATASSGSATLAVPFTDANSLDVVVVAPANSVGRESAASATQTLLKQFAAPIRSSEPTESIASEIKNWNFISLSQTGQYQTAGSTVGLYTSSNYGVTWTLVPTANGVSANASLYSGAISSTGQYQSVFSRDQPNGSYIYTSSDYGVNWTARRNFPIAYQNSISVSSTGQYQSANAESQTIYISSDYGVTWTSKESVYNWQGISISSNGQYQTAVVSSGGMYRSSNWGADWTLVPAANGVPATAGWYSISLSSTGQYQSAVTQGNGSVYISSNFGVNWSVVSAANGVLANTNWINISISSTGQYQTAVAGVSVNLGGIYISSNFGVNWVLSGAPTGINWLSIAVSSTGQYQSASMNSSNRLYFSRDYGFTWSQSVYRVGSDEEYKNVTYAVAEGVSAVKVLNGLDNSVIFSTISVASRSATFTAPLTDLNSPLGIKVVALANSVGRESAASATQTLLKQFAAPTLSGSITYSGTTASMTYTVSSGVTAVQVRKASDNTPIAATTSVSGTSATISIALTDSVSIVVVALANSAGRESAASASQTLGIGFPSEYTTRMQYDGITQPNGIALNGPTQIIMSLSSYVWVFNYLNDNVQGVLSIGSSGSADGLFSQPGAIALDNSKNIVVADTGNKRIQMFTITGTHIRSFGSNGTGNGQFMFPSGVAVNSDNNIIVSDSTNHNVQIFSNTGTFISKFGSAGSANGQFNFASSQDSIAIDHLDNIYVVDGGNMRVQVFNKSGTYLSQKTFEQTPQAIAIDATEKIFIAYSSNVIVIHDKNWNYMDHFGSTGAGSFEFNYIAGIAVDAIGRLHVADRNNNSYKVFGVPPQTLTGPLSQPLLTGAPTYRVPAGTNVYRSTHTYTLDSGVFGIKLSEYDAAYTAGWKPLSNGPTSVSMSNPFDPPRTLATIEMPATTQYRVGVTALSTYTKSRSVISEFYTNPGKKISIPGYNGVVSPMFVFVQHFGSEGTAIANLGNYNVFYRPQGIAHAYYTDGAAVNKSFLIVSDSTNNRALMYDLSGALPSIHTVFGRTNGTSGTGDNELNTPREVAYCYKNKRIAITDSKNHRIMIWQLGSGAGTVSINFFTKFGSFGTTNGQFNTPSGVAFDMDGNIVVADTLLSRIQIFNSNGTHIRTWGTNGTLDQTLDYPRSVAINSVGHVIVGGGWAGVTSSSGVRIFDQYGTFVTKFPGGLSDSSVAVDNSPIGNIIVADYVNHTIHLYTSGGTLIRTYGGSGQFNQPAAVTVDNSGKIYVCERLNHRISIFTNPAPPPPPQQAGGGGVDENVLI